MPAPSSPAPAAPAPFSTAQSSLLRLSRRHSLPTSATLFASLWGSGSSSPRPNNSISTHTPPHSRDRAGTDRPADGSAPPPHQRAQSLSLVRPPADHAGIPGSGNRHRYGHRHTRSELPASRPPLDQPVVVKSYHPEPAAESLPSTIAEDDEDMALPSIEDFSFGGIMKAVEPEVTKALDSVTLLCVKYQESVKTEAESLAVEQTELDMRIKDTDKLRARVFKSTRTRTERFEAERAGFRGGAAVDTLTEATETTQTMLTSILTTLLAIDEMLPPQERLSLDGSVHRGHYPRLHALLADRASELQGCFSSRTDGPASPRPAPPRRASHSNTPPPSLPVSPGLPLGVRRTSMPPHLQLRTILPAPASERPSSSRSSVHEVHTTALATPSVITVQTPTTPRRPGSAATPTFVPIREGEWGFAHEPPSPLPQLRPSRTWGGANWKSSGGWGGLGALWSSRKAGADYADDAAERLRKVLGNTASSSTRGR